MSQGESSQEMMNFTPLSNIDMEEQTSINSLPQMQSTQGPCKPPTQPPGQENPSSEDPCGRENPSSEDPCSHESDPSTTSETDEELRSRFKTLPPLHPHEVELRVPVTELSRPIAPEKFRSRIESVGGFVFGLLIFPRGTKSAPEHAKKNRSAGKEDAKGI